MQESFHLKTDYVVDILEILVNNLASRFRRIQLTGNSLVGSGGFSW